MRTRICLGAVALIIGCQSSGDDARKDPRIQALSVPTAQPSFPSEAVLMERSGRGRIAYLGVDVVPNRPRRGEVVEVTHYFKVEQPATGDYDVFVHGEVPGAGERILVADHAPVLGKLPTNKWRAGETWSDPHRMKIPDDVAASALELYVGLFKGNQRWTVRAPPGATDGRDRILAARLPLSGPAPSDGLPEVVIPKTTAAITVDGRLDEAAWAGAAVLGFADSMGRGTEVKYPTKLRLMYDDTHLYVGFESQDADITERFSKRDDPIYDHETVELFIMPHVAAPALGPYIELQASPGGVIFDASFEGRRRGMNTGFDANQKVATTIDGTLNDPAPDRGWISEWAVPWSGMRGVEGAPKPGDEWRLNAFRIEKHRVGGRLEGEFTAWSPPKVGDFHNVARFGRMKFGDAPAP